MPAASSPIPCSASPAGIPVTFFGARRSRGLSRRARRGDVEHHLHITGPLNQARTSGGLRQQ